MLYLTLMRGGQRGDARHTDLIFALACLGNIVRRLHTHQRVHLDKPVQGTSAVNVAFSFPMHICFWWEGVPSLASATDAAGVFRHPSQRGLFLPRNARP